MSKSKVLPEDWSQEAEQVPAVTVKSDLQEVKSERPAWFWVVLVLLMGNGLLLGMYEPTTIYLVAALSPFIGVPSFQVFLFSLATLESIRGNSNKDEDESPLNFTTSQIKFDFVDPRSPWHGE
ncbi:MAG: hypothetical protein RBS36_00465 [Thiomicrospira sp.]|jgi:hypothetical protein|nr:hypothetical protein [Thiomicrospira sp.]